MKPTQEKILLKFLVVLSNIAIICIFIFSLIIVSTDAQGVFVFIITLPIITGLSVFSIFMSKQVDDSRRRLLRFSKIVIIGLCVFSVSSLVPVLNRIPSAGVDFLIYSFARITGKTPRQYFKDRNNLEKLIQTELSHSGGNKLDISKINTAYNWIRLCIFTPYTSDSVADQLAGTSFKLSQYSDIASSDGIHVIALFDKNSLVNYTNLKRSVIDFDFTDSVCVPRADAILHRQAHGKFKLSP